MGWKQCLPPESKLNVFLEWSEKYDERFNDKGKVETPLRQKERKFLFEHEKYGNEVSVTFEKVKLKWGSVDLFGECMNKMLSLLMDAKEIYDQNEKNSKENKSKRKKGRKKNRYI